MKKKKVLYLHGYGGSKCGSSSTSISKLLDKDKYEFFAIDYDYHADIAMERISHFIKEKGINIIIGSSLGGFLALCQNSIPRLVYNPCYVPSVELPKIGVPSEISETYKQYEGKWYVDSEERIITRAIFTKDDELLGTQYIDKYREDWNDNFVIVDGGHRMTPDNIENVLLKELDKLVKDISLMDNVNKIPYGPNFLD